MQYPVQNVGNGVATDFQGQDLKASLSHLSRNSHAQVHSEQQF